MTVVIEIVDGKVEVRSGTTSAEKGAKAYTIKEQRGYAHIGATYPLPIVIGLEDNHAGYAPGRYELEPSSYVVGRFGNLELAKKLVLRPVPAQKAA